MDDNQKQLVMNIVNSFVADGFMFTAYDVTRSMRKNNIKVLHREVNDVVKSMFNNAKMGDYTRDLFDVGSTSVPWVYMHPLSDVQDYSPDWMQNNPTQENMRYVYAPTIDNESDEDEDDDEDEGETADATADSTNNDILYVTKENRLNIPKHLVRQAQLRPTHNVALFTDDNKIIIDLRSNCANCISPVLTVNCVNADGRLRIGSHIISLFNGINKFKVETVANGTICLKPV